MSRRCGPCCVRSRRCHDHSVWRGARAGSDAACRLPQRHGRLAALVRASLGSDPYSGVIYVFRARRADRVKLLLWDGTGLVLVGKRLEKSSFRWPTISDGVMRLTSSQLSALLEGLDWTRVRAVRVQAPQATL